MTSQTTYSKNCIFSINFRKNKKKNLYFLSMNCYKLDQLTAIFLFLSVWHFFHFQLDFLKHFTLLPKIKSVKLEFAAFLPSAFIYFFLLSRCNLTEDNLKSAQVSRDSIFIPPEHLQLFRGWSYYWLVRLVLLDAKFMWFYRAPGTHYVKVRWYLCKRGDRIYRVCMCVLYFH